MQTTKISADSHSYSDLGGYEPFSESGTMLPPDPELIDNLDLSELDLVAPSNEMMEALRDDDGAEYATYDDKSTDADVPPNLNEDDELPDHSIYARYWVTTKPLKYPKSTCGHKFRAEFEPNHRNCEQCWFTYLTTHKPLVEAVEEAYQKGGAGLIIQLKGKKFLHNFLKYMSTIAFLKQQQERTKASDGPKA